MTSPSDRNHLLLPRVNPSIAGPAGPPGPAGPTGPTGVIASGTALIDFGVVPGTNIVDVVVPSPGIQANTTPVCFMMGDTTVAGALGHNAYEHAVVPLKLTVDPLSIIVGVSFVIRAVTDWRLTSTFLVHWFWF